MRNYETMKRRIITNDFRSTFLNSGRGEPQIYIQTVQNFWLSYSRYQMVHKFDQESYSQYRTLVLPIEMVHKLSSICPG